MTFTRRPIFPKNNFQFWKFKTRYTKTEFKHLFEPYHINIFAHIVVVSIIYEPDVSKQNTGTKNDDCIVFGRLLEIYGLNLNSLRLFYKMASY